MKTLYFSGTTPIVGGLRPVDNEECEARWPGVKGVRYDGFSRMAGLTADGTLMPITRVIFRKSNPSNHACGPRCRNAKGRECECSCGGQFHGAG